MTLSDLVVASAIAAAAAGVIVVGAKLSARHGRQGRRLAAIDRLQFGYATESPLAERYPTLSAAQRREILEGLRDWLRCCAVARRAQLPMPSKAVAVAWGLFTASAPDVGRLRQEAFADEPSLTPTLAGASDPAQDREGTRLVWRTACKLANIDSAKPSRLPRLFALDQAVAWKDGHRWTLPGETGGVSVSGLA
ncbi:hypothetical protein LBMAG53_38570 [Planctomycetota bacterium]|nr:hypothetical protein LBMAG53_38570 [Planctomycetota bacterium]